ncbi:MAG: PEGA domain-containing protein [Omnitrophica bacterium]|nr:PEGA domain-containing protein [Candidatus Omnitrophota bacterium]
MRRFLLIIFVLPLIAAVTGCVRRIVTFDSQPQGAEVYFDRKLIGQTPCKHEFLYYGGHHLELTKEGYTNFNTTLKLKGPIYEYFPLSVFSELLIPWQITDKHSFAFKLEQGQSRKAIVSPIEQPQPGLAAPRLEHIKEKPKQ